MADAATLAALQRQIARLERPSPLGGAPPVLACGHGEIDAAFAGGGLLPGAHQFASGADDPGAATAFAVLLLARALGRPDVRALVVQEVSDLREAGAAYGPGLHALGIDPARLAFLAAPNGAEALRAVNDALALRAAEVVLLGLRRDAGLADLSVTRRFNLAAERGGGWVLLVTPDLAATSAALSRWTVASAPSGALSPVPICGLGKFLGAPAFDLELLRNRHGRLGRWRAAWSSHARSFQPSSVPVSVPIYVRPDRVLIANGPAPPLAASVAA
jgi:protein ImuA